MNMKFLGTMIFGTLAVFGTACTSPSASTQGALSADPTARSFGIESYTVEGDTVRLLDSYGLELGTLVLRDEADRRVIDVALTDGTTDEIEIYRPMADGRFLAPMPRNFLAGAALGDTALASTLASHDVTFKVSAGNADALEPSVVATTTSCDSPTSDTPAGCARPANTSVGCTNPSQLPAAVISDTNSYLDGGGGYFSQSYCQSAAPSTCASRYGGAASDWTYPTHLQCNLGGGYYQATCIQRSTQNQWIASCPRSTCTTVGQYDAVPRLRSCLDPGSCTKSQGTVTCTAYH